MFRITGIYIRRATLRRNHFLIAFFIFMIWPERMVSGTFHTFKILMLRCTAHTPSCPTGTFNPHICKRWCITSWIHSHCAFTCRIAPVNPPAPREIIHMSVLTNSDKTGGVGLFMARWTSYTKLQISIKIEILPYIKYSPTFHIGTNMHIRERDHRNISVIRSPRHIKAVNTKIWG